jgi:hypothetical protein
MTLIGFVTWLKTEEAGEPIPPKHPNLTQGTKVRKPCARAN